MFNSICSKTVDSQTHQIISRIIFFFIAVFTGPEPHRVKTGLAVFLSIAVVCILGALAYIYYRSSKRLLLPTFENPMYQNTEGANSDSKDNKTLLGHIEIAEQTCVLYCPSTCIYVRDNVQSAGHNHKINNGRDHRVYFAIMAVLYPASYCTWLLSK